MILQEMDDIFITDLALLHSEWPNIYEVLAILSVTGLNDLKTINCFFFFIIICIFRKSEVSE